MAAQRPTPSRVASAIRELRLDAWQPIMGPSAPRLLGSLRPILGDFAPAVSLTALVPAQRTVPEVVARLRRDR